MLKFLKRYNLPIIIGLFFVLYNPPIFSFNSMHLVGGVSLAYLIFNKKYRIKKKVFDLFIFYLILWVYLLVVVCLVNGNEISDTVMPLYYLVDIIPFYMAMELYFEKNSLHIQDLIQVVILVGVLQCVLAILAFIYPHIQTYFVQRIIAYGGSSTYTYWSQLRMYGFSNGLMFDTPILQTVIALIAFVNAQKFGKRYWIYGILMFGTSVINARASIVVMGVGLVVLVTISRISTKKKIFMLLGLIVLLGVTVFILLPFVQKNSSMTYEWIMSGIMEIVGAVKGDVDTGYFSYVLDSNRYILPERICELFFGAGTRVLWGYKGIVSDIGYVNDIWLGGIVYVVVLYVYVFSMLWKMKKNNNETVAFLGIGMLILFPILNFKGMIFGMNALMNFICIIYLFSTTHKLEKECRNGSYICNYTSL